MGPAVLFFLVLAAAAPLLLAAQTLPASTVKAPTSWTNNGHTLGYSHGGLRTFVTSSLQSQAQAQAQARPELKFDVAAGFICVSSPSPCNDFLFAVFIYINDPHSINATDPQARVVWSANRVRPVREDAILEFTSDGNLVLRDDDGSHVWSSGSSGRSVAGMVITNIGNLVLFDQRNATVWQSFDHPTDTLLPGQSLLEGMKLKASTSSLCSQIIMIASHCQQPKACGEYSTCAHGQCACPLQKYFKTVDEWKSNLGCTPITPISCQEIQNHRLLTLSNISYFENSHTVLNLNEDDCKQACLKNCSCRAVMFSGDQQGPSICIWMTKVFLQATQPVTNFSYGNSSAYLKVQFSPSISASGMPARFSLEKLSECTEGFSKKLGEGGFGSVFEGKLGEERIAVKRLEGARQGKKEFLAEVETIGSIEHINLVSLIGFCAEKSERLLVYEYMSRGSLDRWIYYRHNSDLLGWCTRCRIILDIAKGLCYLHEECRRKIAHLDIKPQNILLDGNFNAKVADFGLCKLINRDQSKVVTVMRGTPGYLAPEWLTLRITEKVDVYSFGVVVMEIVSGRKNIDNSQPEEDVQLINLLREKAQNGQLIDLIDKHSDDMISRQEEVIQMMKLAVWCLQNDSTRRPSMSTVIKILEGAMSVETFDANSIMFVQDNPSTCSDPYQASILSGPR